MGSFLSCIFISIYFFFRLRFFFFFVVKICFGKQNISTTKFGRIIPAPVVPKIYNTNKFAWQSQAHQNRERRISYFLLFFFLGVRDERVKLTNYRSSKLLKKFNIFFSLFLYLIELFLFYDFLTFPFHIIRFKGGNNCIKGLATGCHCLLLLPFHTPKKKNYYPTSASASRELMKL